MVGEHGLLLIVALVETCGRPSKGGGSNFAHMVNIDDVAIFYQNSWLASETLAGGSAPRQAVRVEDPNGADAEIWFDLHKLSVTSIN